MKTLNYKSPIPAHKQPSWMLFLKADISQLKFDCLANAKMVVEKYLEDYTASGLVSRSVLRTELRTNEINEECLMIFRNDRVVLTYYID